MRDRSVIFTGLRIVCEIESTVTHLYKDQKRSSLLLPMGICACYKSRTRRRWGLYPPEFQVSLQHPGRWTRHPARLFPSRTRWTTRTSPAASLRFLQYTATGISSRFRQTRTESASSWSFSSSSSSPAGAPRCWRPGVRRPCPGRSYSASFPLPVSCIGIRSQVFGTKKWT